MCSRYFLELKALMELEDKIDYPFEPALKDKIDYYPSNNIFIIENNNDKLIGCKARWGYKIFDNKLVINARQETIQEKSLFKKILSITAVSFLLLVFMSGIFTNINLLLKMKMAS